MRDCNCYFRLFKGSLRYRVTEETSLANAAGKVSPRDPFDYSISTLCKWHFNPSVYPPDLSSLIRFIPYVTYISQIFAHRDAYEQVVSKTEEKLQRARLDYKRAYAALLTNEAGGGAEQELKRAYLESHNAYILQLRATNAVTERYQFHCLPGLLGEIAEVYEELCGLACKCVAGISDAAGERTAEQAKRYQAVAKEAQAVIPTNDLQVLMLAF